MDPGDGSGDPAARLPAARGSDPRPDAAGPTGLSSLLLPGAALPSASSATGGSGTGSGHGEGGGKGQGGRLPASGSFGPSPAEGGGGLHLSSEELGLLSLRVEGGETALRLIIEAQRPETADLLRRHAEMLRQDLRAEGLAGIAVTIGRDGGDGDRADGGGHPVPDRAPIRDSPAPPDSAVLPSAPPGPAGTAGRGSLDLRL